MKALIGLGSNLGDRGLHLERAAQELKLLSRGGHLRRSAVYRTPALMPTGSDSSWNQSYLNAVVEIEWDHDARELLLALKNLELKLGRQASARWAPRVIDLDILLLGEQVIAEDDLCIPHTEILNRSFVLDPLKDLMGSAFLPGSGDSRCLIEQARRCKQHQPWVMGILNLTPDSFSDGNSAIGFESIREKIIEMVEAGVQAIDIGAESTRPGAAAVDIDEEWRRLKPALEVYKELLGSKIFRPFLSVDTRQVEIARRALLYGVDCINDVSGLADISMLELLKGSSCDYVLMHSLSVPADPKIVLPSNCDVVLEIKKWLLEKLEIFRSSGIDLNRIIFDPGIGFGKSAEQSWYLLKNLDEFKDLPVRVLVGHSRKSFLQKFAQLSIGELKMDVDTATLAVSLAMREHGVDILRVHDFKKHVTALSVTTEMNP